MNACIHSLMSRSAGLIGFFRGVLPSTLKVVPSSAVTFLVYEEAMKGLRALDVAR